MFGRILFEKSLGLKQIVIVILFYNMIDFLYKFL